MALFEEAPPLAPPPASIVGQIRLWSRALRLHQWVKNVLLFVPLVIAREFDGVDARDVSLGFLIFGVVASGTYLVNDLNDLAADRAHPTKRYRAIASGRIGRTTATVVSAILITGGLAASFWLMPAFGVCAVAYVALTLAYSLKLKSEPLFDVFTIGVLFLMRLVAGMLLIDNPISLWLSAFAFTLFMSLAMAKRHSELTVALRESGRMPKGRGYQPEDTELTRTFGIGSALIAFLIMVLYFQFQALSTGLYDDIQWLYVIPVAVFAWTLRIWLKAHRGLLRDDPIVFALKDRTSWFYAALIGAVWLIAAKF